MLPIATKLHINESLFLTLAKESINIHLPNAKQSWICWSQWWKIMVLITVWASGTTRCCQSGTWLIDPTENSSSGSVQVPKLSCSSLKKKKNFFSFQGGKKLFCLSCHPFSQRLLPAQKIFLSFYVFTFFPRCAVINVILT